jgi:hypothetical protein
LARGAALASASAPRFDTSTIGLAYSLDPDGTTVYPLALAVDTTTFFGHANSSADTADIASDSDDVSERNKPFLLMGSSLTAIFVAGLLALTIALAVNIQQSGDTDSSKTTVPPSAAAPPLGVQSAPSVAPQPAAPPLAAATVTARLKVPPAPPPQQVVVHDAAPAPAAPPPAPAGPPPVVVAPVIPPLIPWLPPILQPPPFFNPGPRGPWGLGGGGHGGGHGRG